MIIMPIITNIYSITNTSINMNANINTRKRTHIRLLLLMISLIMVKEDQSHATQSSLMQMIIRVMRN